VASGRRRRDQEHFVEGEGDLLYHELVRIPFRVIVTASWLVATGCGGSGQKAGEPIAVGDFPARMASEWCGLLNRCCLASGGVAMGTCEADIMAQVTSIGGEAAADGATWDAVVAGQCIAGLQAADCASADLARLVDLLDVCDDTWKGVVPPGGACMTYASCAEPAVSGGASAGASCVNSMCVQVLRQPAGAPCSQTPPVLLTCDPLVAACGTGVCVALPGAGEACAGNCRSGWRCVSDVCVPQLAAGQTCTVDGECISGGCRGGRCVSVFVSDAEYCTLP